MNRNTRTRTYRLPDGTLATVFRGPKGGLIIRTNGTTTTVKTDRSL